MTPVETLAQAFWWYLILTIIGLAALPIVVTVCGGLTDRGLFLARPVGLLLVTIPIWWLGNLTPFPFTTWSITGTAMLVAAIAWFLALRDASITSFLRQRWRYALTLEGVTAGLFSGYVLLRGFNPDIQGTEKPMELAFLSAAIRSDQIPVADPWFAGEPINYYYLGYVLLAVPAKLGGIDGAIAFNLGLSTTFALATIAAGGLATEFAHRLSLPPSSQAGAGVLAGFLVMLSGNLHAFRQLLSSPDATLQAGWWDGIGWGSSRVVTDTGFPGNGERLVITEFPAFSWILGDLHPHVIALPWLMIAFAIAANLSSYVNSSSVRSGQLTAAAASGLIIGSLYAMNSWDVPIAVLVTFLAATVPALATGVRRAIEPLLVAAGIAILVAVPFAMNYDAASGVIDYQATGIVALIPGAAFVASSIGLVNWDRTSSSELLIIHGGFLVLIVIVLAASGLLLMRGAVPRWLAPAAGISLVALALLALAFSAPALALVGMPLVLLLLLALLERASGYRRFLILILVAGLLMVLIPEFIYVQDPFADRMNTVFKLYFQAWTILSITLSVLIIDSMRRLTTFADPMLANAAFAGAMIVVLATAVYAPLSAYRWFDEFQNWRGIDGIAWIREIQPDDVAAIDWLKTEADQHAVVLEAPGCSYGSDNWIPHNRASMATGIPTVIGWDGHQRQWRRQQDQFLPLISQRVDRSRLVFEQPADPIAREIVEQHEITYVLIGVHEVRGYAQCPHGPPYEIPDEIIWEEAGWRLVFEQGEVQIWERESR